jgi:hypothetical protein
VNSDDLLAQIAALGGPAAANAAVVGEREGTGGLPALAGKDQAALALLDRASQGAMAREQTGLAGALLGLPGAAAYEGAKAVEQSPFANALTRTLLEAAGGPVNEKTSPASADNVMAYLRGILAEPEQMHAPAPPVRMAGR